MSRKLSTISIVFIAIICTVLVSACANKIRLAEETIPTPLVQTQPKSMAISYDISLQESVAKLVAAQFGDIHVYVLKAQNVGFEKTFQRLFQHTITVSSLDSVPATFDGLISIKLDKFEILEQRKTSNTFIYFAEISYDIDIFDENNKFSHSINAVGEGQAYDKDLVPAKLIKEASINALRDAFSSIVIELIDYTESSN